MIEQVINKDEKMAIARKILEALPEWFGIPEYTEDYITKSADQIVIKATLDGKEVGFLALKETGKDTLGLEVMGVLKEYHRQGVGRKLFEAAKACAIEQGYSFIQVKTVQMGCYEEYDATNNFYLSLGFKDFEVMKTLWDECNPCQIYVMSLT